MTCNLMFFPLYFWRNCLIFKSSYLGCCNALMPWNLMLVMSRWWSKHWLNWMVEHRLSKGNCCIETCLSTYDCLVLARIYPSKNILYLFFLLFTFLSVPCLFVFLCLHPIQSDFCIYPLLVIALVWVFTCAYHPCVLLEVLMLKLFSSDCAGLWFCTLTPLDYGNRKVPQTAAA